jgi:Raf kinase inhibitor-like YbhB/YbcL family protein
MKMLKAIPTVVLAFLTSVSFAFAQNSQDGGFQVSSTTFANDIIMPLSTISNIQANGVNACSLTGAPGGDESPELSWTEAPAGTQSFAVTAFDVMAGFAHWGMYNISAEATGLPENAGVTGSKYGEQVINSFGSAGSNADINYGGPCPPADYPPNVHHYVFTVYALDTALQLPFSANFPPTALALFQALTSAGEEGHILASANITGLYTTTPAE